MFAVLVSVCVGWDACPRIRNGRAACRRSQAHRRRVAANLERAHHVVSDRRVGVEVGHRYRLVDGVHGRVVPIGGERGGLLRFRAYSSRACSLVVLEACATRASSSLFGKARPLFRARFKIPSHALRLNEYADGGQAPRCPTR